MELVLDEAQTILWESAEKLVGRHAGPARHRAVRDREHGFDPARLAVVAEAGWLSLLAPEERNGLGLGATEAALVLEAAGRGLMTEPVTAMMAAAAVLAAGPAPLGAALDELTAGRSVILPALHDPAAAGPESPPVTAAPAGRGFRLTGRTGAVPGAAAAHGFVVDARAREGVMVCLVPRSAPGLELEGRTRVDGTDRMFVNLCISSLGRAPSPIYRRFVNHSCLCPAVSAARRALSLVLVCAVACFPCLAMVSEQFWKYSEYTCSLQAAKLLTIKACARVPIRSHA